MDRTDGPTHRKVAYRVACTLQKQGRIHGKTVADGWAGAVMQKPLEIQKYLLRTDLPTDRPRCRVACPRLKRKEKRRGWTEDKDKDKEKEAKEEEENEEEEEWKEEEEEKKKDENQIND